MQDYLHGRAPASGFFQGSPFDLDSFRRKLEEVRARFGRAERERAAGALRPTSPAARERLHRFVEEGGAVVTTGQQAGFLTGPLYTVYKALTAARLADHLQERLGVIVVPVFWTASEDHDWEEANHADLLVPRHGVQRVRLPGSPTLPRPMSETYLSQDVRNVLDSISQLIGSEPYADECMKLVRAAYSPGESVAGAFSELLGELLAPFDVCLTDAADPVLKRASVPVLRRALTDAHAQEAILAGRTKEIEEAGYGAQVAVLPGATNVFYEGDAGRERLYRRGDHFVGNDSGTRLTPEELEEVLEHDPKLLSPNVFLRPVVESAVFPTLAYVAGPGEASYFAQLGPLFPEFGMQAPVIFPRGSATLVEPAVARLAERLGMGAADLAGPWHEVRHATARRAVAPELQEALARLSRAVADGYAAAMAQAGAVDPELPLALASLRNEALANVGEAEQSVVRHVKRREALLLEQVARLRANLRPEGELQERVLNVLPFLARHGGGLLQAAADAFGAEMAERFTGP
ncbi:MAG TPA: bacillithiol biosynthesis cysteine-adding enzyme BshC [Longimicrobiaceae bacterium]|nr:bacillithiol biosynthesis cysteine-adding enzyme BshC [Longimicrobiaceae bacterium]